MVIIYRTLRAREQTACGERTANDVPRNVGQGVPMYAFRYTEKMTVQFRISGRAPPML
jgi:hypothetical protein